ncbi:response regulator transcription factor [Undibacterium jejuense]|uniref:Response regulator transcription factor n=1 Tax=Undibacterium jejuense TaxID=1344949 RepID=A0A923KQC5_9BURK|nr:LytTR family DNA-binding domain-containing protein [Undibacterium jejuense]MBC3862934.1 response regulator transcription factor [Undibacterium jejuense]
MNQAPTIKALIAEDESILSLTLQRMLGKLWPELELCSVVENGIEAVQAALSELPDVLFLDIKMPGKTGLEVAQELAEEWPAEQPFPMVVYVTAYDEFAVQAFETCAADYVLKPISEERLNKTIKRLQEHFQARTKTQNDRQQPESELERVIVQLRQLHQIQLPNSAENLSPTTEKLSVIRAAVGNNIRIIPIEDVIYFEATDKYINVVTAEHSSLIRSSLRDLLPQLDSSLFWQIHRSTVVNVKRVHMAHKDESGKITLKLKNSDDKLSVSRVYAHLFKQM